MRRLLATKRSVTSAEVTDGAGWSTVDRAAHLAVPCAIRRSGGAAHSAALSDAKKSADIEIKALCAYRQETNPDCPIEGNKMSFVPNLDEVNPESVNFKRTSSPRKRGSSDFIGAHDKSLDSRFRGNDDF